MAEKLRIVPLKGSIKINTGAMLRSIGLWPLIKMAILGKIRRL